MLLRILFALADRFRNFCSLAEAGTNMTIAVAYDNERRETHVAAALDDLCNTLDGNNSVFQAVLILIYSFILVLSHQYSPSS